MLWLPSTKQKPDFRIEFPSPLLVELVDGEDFLFRLIGAFDVVVRVQGEEVVCFKIHPGFMTDFASVPRFLWSILPPIGKYAKAAVLHDALYRFQVFSRKVCDYLFLLAMEACRVPFWERYALYWGVRIGGWVVFNKYGKKTPTDGKFEIL